MHIYIDCIILINDWSLATTQVVVLGGQGKSCLAINDSTGQSVLATKSRLATSETVPGNLYLKYGWQENLYLQRSLL